MAKDNIRKESDPVRLETRDDLPYILDGPTVVNNSTLVTLKCRSGNPRHDHFYWYRDDKVITLPNNSSKRLEFRPFKFGDEGVYTCRASDSDQTYHLRSRGRNLTAVGRYQLCKCKCPKGIEKMKMTEKQLEEKVKEIEKTLTVDVTILSKTIRKKQAAENVKKTATVVCSAVAIIIFCLSGTFLLAADALSLVTYIYSITRGPQG